ncbi:MAG: permease [Candidatus Cloacimonetes bacterium]|nr:permease [Candidatus Cloacimonadota bacterium]
MKKKQIYYLFPALVIGAALGSKISGFTQGALLWDNLWQYLKTMLMLLPPVFILIGLFEVWVKQETIRKHLGASHGISAWFWLMLLSATTVGGLYVSLPLGYALYKKGARLRLVYGFLGFSTVCRIPMTFFEASFLGLKFTLIRYAVALPLVIISAIFLEKIVGRQISATKQ